MTNLNQDKSMKQKELTKLIELAKKNAENQILRAYYISVFEMSPLVDKLSTWILAGIGATAALTVTNIESITAIIPFFIIKIGLAILTVSALLGFLAKFLSLDIQSTVAQELRLKDILKKSSDEFHQKILPLQLVAAESKIDLSSEVDTKKVLGKFAKAHPWYKRIKIRNNISAEDAQEARLKRYYRQLVYTVLEFCGFLSFIIIVLFSI
jgi:hypothetical protein